MNIAALAGCAVGLLMTWGSAFIANVNGIDTDDGKFFGAVLLVTALLTWWRFRGSNRVNSVLSVVAWMGLAGIVIAEIVHVSSSQYVSVGAGLYVDVAAATAGLVTLIMDMWQRDPDPQVAFLRPSEVSSTPRDDAPELDKKPNAEVQSVAAELREFAALRDEGILTAEEFAVEKAKLLSR
jgi:hypothetical protein